MKKVKWHLSIGYVGAEHSGTLEFYDDATEEDIEEAVQDAANNYIDIWWSIEE